MDIHHYEIAFHRDDPPQAVEVTYAPRAELTSELTEVHPEEVIAAVRVPLSSGRRPSLVGYLTGRRMAFEPDGTPARGRLQHDLLRVYDLAVVTHIAQFRLYETVTPKLRRQVASALAHAARDFARGGSLQAYTFVSEEVHVGLSLPVALTMIKVDGRENDYYGVTVPVGVLRAVGATGLELVSPAGYRGIELTQEELDALIPETPMPEQSHPAEFKPEPRPVPEEFRVHKLNNRGLAKAQAIADKFSELLFELEHLVPPGRHASVMRTKLEEACFFAKKGMAFAPENKEPA